jgi:hypothetical protein
VANLEATVNTLAVVGGYTFGEKVFGATYTAVAALPYAFMDVSANAQLPGGGTRRIANNVSGFGDLTVIPLMMGWKEPESPWQFNALLPIYAPTGSYELGRLGNPGLPKVAGQRRAPSCAGRLIAVNVAPLREESDRFLRTWAPSCTS